MSELLDLKGYQKSMNSLYSDGSRYAAIYPRRTRMEIPADLVKQITSTELYKDLQAHTVRLFENICEIGEWSRGIDDEGRPYIRFFLFPERLRDET